MSVAAIVAILVVLAMVVAAAVVVTKRRLRGAAGTGAGGLPLLTPPPQTLPPTSDAPLPEPAGEPRLRDRLGKTRAAFASVVAGLGSRGGADSEDWEDLEEALILADVGVATASKILDGVKAKATNERADAERVLELLKNEILSIVATGDRDLAYEQGASNVWMFVGVNGVGKTTTIAKLAAREVKSGRKVVMAAADTFRAAAAEQLAHWAELVGADLVRGQDGADPGSVVFDAMNAAVHRGADLVLVDTAGRLHTKVNLMEELKKLRRIVDRTPGALKEVLLVLDASTGQNGLAQARQFADAVEVTGVVLTKLDGTAKGGIVLAIQAELGLPVKLVGIGETADDLVAFDPVEFVDALFA
ncbi:MAG: signal recognition particle-docking protein FtsY [Acidimicrobiia bacterium]|nr:signal recognition particle-docking protein FtsY [Acidimicrobiia bacterium]